MAGWIRKEDIEKVRSTADLYDVVSQTVTLKPAGTGSFVGLCPFHEEKTPSFNVRPEMGTWHCFGCGEGGDIFGFVEKRDSVDFAEAVEILADMYNIELHHDSAERGPKREGSTRTRLLQANEEAQKFFASNLLSKEALPARQLLGGRNFTLAQAQEFGCGYAPRGWDNLTRYLAGKGFTQKEMLDAGLARQGQHGIYDYFRGRATWPIRDSTGRLLGFGARKLYDDDTMAAKYINTPETALYKKARVLYGIDLAKKAISSKRQIVIVEGYTDVMACHIAGVNTAVATCGTAFGYEHAKIVRRLISDDSLGAIQMVGPVNGSKVIFTFDGDAAGQKAAMHAFRFDGAFLTQTFVAVAPDNLDPCDLRIQRGDEAVRQLLAHATPLYDFVIDTALKMFDQQYSTGRMGALKAVAPVVAQIRDRSLMGEYERKVARELGEPVAVVHREVSAARRKLGVRDEDAYAPRRSSANPYGTTPGHEYEALAGQRGNEEGARTRALINQRATVRRDARSQNYFRIDDSVFMCEQQFFGMVIQMPNAIDRALFNQLTADSFAVPVFRSLFHAVQVTGGIPKPGDVMRVRESESEADAPVEIPMTEGLWVHNLTKAGGPLLESVISQLSVMPLPLSVPPRGQSAASGVRDVSADARGGAAFAPASDEARRYAAELMLSLIDQALLRQSAALEAQMKAMSDENAKMQVFAALAKLDVQRKEIRAKIAASPDPRRI